MDIKSCLLTPEWTRALLCELALLMLMSVMYLNTDELSFVCEESLIKRLNDIQISL